MAENYDVIKKAIEKLSFVINVSTGLAHPLDDSRAKELFNELHQRSIVIEYQDIYTLAIQNGWIERHAKKLAEVAQKIGNGGVVKISDPRDWGGKAVDEIMQELASRPNA